MRPYVRIIIAYTYTYNEYMERGIVIKAFFELLKKQLYTQWFTASMFTHMFSFNRQFIKILIFSIFKYI